MQPSTLECRKDQPIFPEQLEKVVSSLFPKEEPFNYQVKQETEQIPPITREKILRENKRIGNSKIPGMGNIFNVALKSAFNAIPETFLDMYNTCPAERIFTSDGSGRDLCSCRRVTIHWMNRHPIVHCVC